ncbi:hypothetical protein QQ056_19770 [Oscillatoria laete-virens NRMC-F 0139]|nr:hypothetical protein [Oscillatoria laete-virens NRMC-F 0139]
MKDSRIGRGAARFIPAQTTGPGNQGFDAIQAILWESGEGGRDLVLVNLSAQECDARLPLFFVGIGGRSWRLKDRLGGEEYIRDGDGMSGPGLYVKLPAYGAQIFEISRHA